MVDEFLIKLKEAGFLVYGYRWRGYCG